MVSFTKLVALMPLLLTLTGSAYCAFPDEPEKFVRPIGGIDRTMQKRVPVSSLLPLATRAIADEVGGLQTVNS